MWDTFKWIFGGLLTLLGILIGVLYKVNEDRHTKHDRRMEALQGDIRLVEANCIGKDTWIRMDRDWKDELAAMREERKELHRENSERLDKIGSTLTQVVELAVIVRAMGEEVKGLREAKHDHGDMIQSHEARLHFLEKDK